MSEKTPKTEEKTAKKKPAAKYTIDEVIAITGGMSPLLQTTLKRMHAGVKKTWNTWMPIIMKASGVSKSDFVSKNPDK